MGDRTGQSNSRGVGWEYVHICIDDASRLAVTDIHPDEKATSAIACLRALVAYCLRLGITVARVMTDNGSCYKSFAFAAACNALNLKHIRTKPYTPKTNGKAERFIQTALREWAYCRPYSSSAQRRRSLDPWLRYYNHRRPHGGIKGATPISRLTQPANNVVGIHI